MQLKKIHSQKTLGAAYNQRKDFNNFLTFLIFLFVLVLIHTEDVNSFEDDIYCIWSSYLDTTLLSKYLQALFQSSSKESTEVSTFLVFIELHLVK